MALPPTKESRLVHKQSGITDARNDFPVLDQKVHGNPLVYLDSAASAQKPRVVVEVVSNFYLEDYSNIHRGLHELSERATKAYEQARGKAAKFLGATDPSEIIFVRGATEGINLVAHGLGKTRINQGDEIIISEMEHHSNIVPWQIVCEERGAVLRVIPVTDEGDLDMAAFEDLLGPKTRLVAITHVSNVLGTVNPVAEIIRKAHGTGALVLLDGAQAVPHRKVDVKALGCDFYVFSGHKVYGPSGIGVLYGKRDLMDTLPPYQSGGDMIMQVELEKSTYRKSPHRFEAGTPNIAGVIGLGAALDYLNLIGLKAIETHELDLLKYGQNLLGTIKGLKTYGESADKVGVFSFSLQDVHPHDIGTILDQEGVAIRAGHHCTQPLMKRFGVPAMARASLGLYNRKEDLDKLALSLEKVLKVFS